MKISSQTSWIPARSLVWRLSPHVGGDEAAKRLIADRMKDHSVNPRVDWIADGIDVPELPRGTHLVFPADSPPVDMEAALREASRPIVSDSQVGPNFVRSLQLPASSKPMRLGPGFWNLSDNWEKDLQRWDWGRGCFVVSREAALKDGKPIRVRAIAFNIHFEETDAKRLVASVKVSKSGAFARRRAPRKYEWEPIILSLMKIIREPGFEQKFGQIDAFGTLAALECWIHEEFGELNLHPNEAYVRERAIQFIDAIR